MSHHAHNEGISQNKEAGRRTGLLPAALFLTGVFTILSACAGMTGKPPSTSAKSSPITIKPFTIPEAGTDVTEITLIEKYNIEGVGSDTVKLKGHLVAERGAPLLGRGEKQVSWETSTVVARFSELKLEGNSEVFGPVKVTLDDRFPAFGVVKAGACKASISVKVDMPQIGQSFRTMQPVQLVSDVKTVPPIGDEKTVSIQGVNLIDKAGRTRGELVSARIIWRSLIEQKAIR